MPHVTNGKGAGKDSVDPQACQPSHMQQAAQLIPEWSSRLQLAEPYISVYSPSTKIMREIAGSTFPDLPYCMHCPNRFNRHAMRKEDGTTTCIFDQAIADLSERTGRWKKHIYRLMSRRDFGWVDAIMHPSEVSDNMKTAWACVKSVTYYETNVQEEQFMNFRRTTVFDIRFRNQVMDLVLQVARSIIESRKMADSVQRTNLGQVFQNFMDHK